MSLSPDVIRVRLAAVLSDQFDLAELLGVGAFAVVFRAHDRFLDRDVAVKVLDPGLAPSPEQQEQFLREARIIASVEHPFIVPLYSAESRDGLLYLIMRLLSGRTLATHLAAERRLAPAEAARLAHEIAQALQMAHERGVVHRDVKPENILLDGSGHAIVTDFGVSQLTARASDNLGVAVGTPGYMSPEQALGEAVDGKADIYALGVVLFEMLAGRAPFEATSLSGLLKQHVADAPPNLRRFRPETPLALADLTMRALAKEPGQRPSAGELSTELEAARQPDALLSPGAARWRRIRPRLPAAGIAIVAAVGAWLAWTVGWLLIGFFSTGRLPSLDAVGANIPIKIIDSLRAAGAIHDGEQPLYVFAPGNARHGEMLVLTDSAFVWVDGANTRRWAKGSGGTVEFGAVSQSGHSTAGYLAVKAANSPSDTLATGLSGAELARFASSMKAAMCLRSPERCPDTAADTADKASK